MSKLTNLSFVEKGAEAEEKFAKMVDGYLGEEEKVEKTLEDGTKISIYAQDFEDRGKARYVILDDGDEKWEFVLYPIANNDPNTRFVGLRYKHVAKDLSEMGGAWDSGDLATLLAFLDENL